MSNDPLLNKFLIFSLIYSRNYVIVIHTTWTKTTGVISVSRRCFRKTIEICRKCGCINFPFEKKDVSLFMILYSQMEIINMYSLPRVRAVREAGIFDQAEWQAQSYLSLIQSQNIYCLVPGNAAPKDGCHCDRHLGPVRKHQG